MSLFLSGFKSGRRYNMKKGRKYKNSPYKQEVFKIKIYHNVLSTYWNIWYVPKWVHPCYCSYNNDDRNYKMGQLILKEEFKNF